MSAFPFTGAAVDRMARGFEELKSNAAVDTAWMVLEAANDLGDQATITLCRRVIDAGLNGKPASPPDLQIIHDYFG